MTIPHSWYYDTERTWAVATDHEQEVALTVLLTGTVATPSIVNIHGSLVTTGSTEHIQFLFFFQVFRYFFSCLIRALN